MLPFRLAVYGMSVLVRDAYAVLRSPVTLRALTQ